MTQETLAAFMGRALYAPETGYYMKHVPIGPPEKRGDFITAPEISQIFGEMVGAWVYDAWIRLGRPTPCQLVECGPGRGTLMADVLRALQVIPEQPSPFTVTLVEVSPRLRTMQQFALKKSGTPVKWVLGVGAISPGPTIFIGNEFFDAFPSDQYQLGESGWERRYVLCDGAACQPLWRAETPPPAFFEVWPGGLDSGIYEYAPALQSWFADWLARSGPMAALWIDYGYGDAGHGDSLQAVSGHQRAGPFTAPGTVDLTTHVNFGALARQALDQGAQVRLDTQAAFLTGMGIEARLAHLLKGATRPQAETLVQGALRLVAPSAMGTLFKVMEVRID